jgi:hypothetical protein
MTAQLDEAAQVGFHGKLFQPGLRNHVAAAKHLIHGAPPIPVDGSSFDGY